MERDVLRNAWPEWQAVREIGAGSYGVVYEAVRTDHAIQSRAAVKVISIPQNQFEIDTLRAEGVSANGTKTYLQRIVDDCVSEIQVMEYFKGVQNIVSVEDYKVVEKTDGIGWDIYIRMELLVPFNTYLGDRILTEQEVIKVGEDICSALILCEKNRVIHRDIKPENIFVNQYGDFKLGDFGIARKLENINIGLSRKGTFNYMAPEIERSNHYDSTVDLYSLGLVLYRLMNRNRLPFLNSEVQLTSPNERAAAIRRRMNGEPLPAPSNASEAMTQIILRACAFDPHKRFTSAAEMRDALLRVSNGLYAVKPTARGKLIHFGRRTGEARGNTNRSTVFSPTHSVNEKTMQPTLPIKQDGRIGLLKKERMQTEPQKKKKNTFGKGSKRQDLVGRLLVACTVLAIALAVGGGVYAVSSIILNGQRTRSVSTPSFPTPMPAVEEGTTPEAISTAVPTSVPEVVIAKKHIVNEHGFFKDTAPEEEDFVEGDFVEGDNGGNTDSAKKESGTKGATNKKNSSDKQDSPEETGGNSDGDAGDGNLELAETELKVFDNILSSVKADYRDYIGLTKGQYRERAQKNGFNISNQNDDGFDAVYEDGSNIVIIGWMENYLFYNCIDRPDSSVVKKSLEGIAPDFIRNHIGEDISSLGISSTLIQKFKKATKQIDYVTYEADDLRIGCYNDSTIICFNLYEDSSNLTVSFIVDEDSLADFFSVSTW